MGGNISTAEDSKASVAPPPAAVSHDAFSPKYQHHQNHHYKNYHNSYNRASDYNDGSTLIEIQEPRQLVISAPSFTPNYHYNQKPSTNHKKSKSPPAAALVPSSKVVKLHRVVNFHSSPSCRGYLEASKASNTLIVVDFTNGWCGRCRYMEPVLHEFAAKYTNVEFIKIDVDQLYDVAQEYGVQATPTFLLMKKGRIIDKVAGTNREELQTKIEKHNSI